MHNIDFKSRRQMGTETTRSAILDLRFSESNKSPVSQLQSSRVCAQEISDILLKNNCMLGKTTIKRLFPINLHSPLFRI